jgi:transposase-like protein
MMPPNNDSISLLKDEIGVTETTLYKWRNESHIAGSATLLVMVKGPNSGVVKINI